MASTSKYLYLDSDTTPPCRSKYQRGSIEIAKRTAFAMLATVESGQIGLYEDAHGTGFKGYCIKDDAHADPRWEEAQPDPTPEEMAPTADEIAAHVAKLLKPYGRAHRGHTTTGSQQITYTPVKSLVAFHLTITRARQ